MFEWIESFFWTDNLSCFCQQLNDYYDYICLLYFPFQSVKQWTDIEQLDGKLVVSIGWYQLSKAIETESEPSNFFSIPQWSIYQANKYFSFHKVWYICALMRAKSCALWQTAVYRSIANQIANQIARLRDSRSLRYAKRVYSNCWINLRQLLLYVK